MASGQKYAELPGLDTAPDTYETQVPDRPDSPDSENGSIVETASKIDPNDPSTSGISNDHVDAEQARQHFRTYRIDASKTTDFSDRLGERQDRGYHVSKSRRRRRGRVEEYTNGAFSDEDDTAADDETWAERLARLKREVEELQADKDAEAQKGNDAEQLSKLLEQLDTEEASTSSRQPRTETDAAKDTSTTERQPAQPFPADYLSALTKATTLETRLAALETALGIHEAPLLDTNSTTTTTTTDGANTSTRKPLIPAIALLERQMTSLSSTTGPNLDALRTQISQLTTEAKRLEEARHAAREEAAKAAEQAQQQRDAAAAAPSRARAVSHAAGSPTVQNESSGNAAEAERARKLDEIWRALPAVHAAAEVVPAMLDRLRSLRGIHAAAGGAAQVLEEVQARQGALEKEIKQWTEGLEKVEGLIGEFGQKTDGNSRTVEGWVKSLEERVAKLG